METNGCLRNHSNINECLKSSVKECNICTIFSLSDIYNRFNQEAVNNIVWNANCHIYCGLRLSSLHTLLMRNVDQLVITCQVNVPLLKVPENTANKEFHTMFVFSFIKIKRGPSSYYHTLLPGAFPK